MSPRALLHRGLRGLGADQLVTDVLTIVVLATDGPATDGLATDGVATDGLAAGMAGSRPLREGRGPRRSRFWGNCPNMGVRGGT